MKYRRLGKTGMNVSLLSLGSGGPNRFGQLRYVRRDKIYRLVHRALDYGINFFDTAASYQHSELLLGQALRGIPGDRYYLASKVRPVARGTVISASSFRRQVERSLTSLGTDTLDLLQLHGVTLEHYDAALTRLMPVLEDLRDEGKIRFIGITETTSRDPQHEMLGRVMNNNCFDTIMVAYHPANAGAAREVLPWALRNDVGVIAMTAARHLINRNLPARLKLSTRSLASIAAYPRSRDGLKQQLWAAISALRPTRNRTENSVGRDEITGKLTLPAAGYMFAASHPAIATVLTGTADEAHLAQNLDAILGPALTADELDQLQHLLK